MTRHGDECIAEVDAAIANLSRSISSLKAKACNHLELELEKIPMIQAGTIKQAMDRFDQQWADIDS